MTAVQFHALTPTRSQSVFHRFHQHQHTQHPWYPCSYPVQTPLTAPVTKTVACRHCETTEFMSSDTAVEEPRSLLGLRRNVLTSSRHGGDKDKKEPSDNPSSSKIKRVSVDAAFLISDQLRQLCSRQIPRPMNLLTNKGCKLVGSFLSSSQILRFCGF